MEHLVLLGFLEKSNNYFSQNRPKMNQVCFLSDFRHLNKQLKCKLYPMTKINEILLKVEGLRCSVSLNVNMVYYHIRIGENKGNLCMNIIPWVKYRYNHLPMGDSKSPEILQHKLNDLF